MCCTSISEHDFQYIYFFSNLSLTDLMNKEIESQKKVFIWIYLDLDIYVVGPFSKYATGRELGMNVSPNEKQLS